jgi:hypothetical protein
MPGKLTFHGPYSRAFNFIGNSTLSLGSQGQSIAMSGSLTGDRLFLMTSKCTMNVYGNLDISNVYSPNAAGLITGYRSDVIFANSLPITASIASPNYRSVSDINMDDNVFFYTDLPIITSENSKLDNRLVYANAKVVHTYPMQTSNNITLTGSAQLISSLVKLNPYATLPAGSLGLMAVSGSSLYFHNGTSWNKVI